MCTAFIQKIIIPQYLNQFQVSGKPPRTPHRLELESRLGNLDCSKTWIAPKPGLLQNPDCSKTRIAPKPGLLQNPDCSKTRIAPKPGLLQNPDCSKTWINPKLLRGWVVPEVPRFFTRSVWAQTESLEDSGGCGGTNHISCMVWVRMFS